MTCLTLFSIISFVNARNYTNFVSWIERSCKPFDTGTLTALPHFNICQHNFLYVSNMIKFEKLPQVNSERWLSLCDFEGEIWKDVVGYEGLYQVSNYGRLKSLTKRCRIPNNTYISVPCERILVFDIINGYCKITLCKNGKTQKTSVHRIESLAFTPNPENKPCIDHIDGNRMNNCLYNLRWCTVKENMNNDITIQRISKSKMGVMNPFSKRVVQYNLDGSIVKVWDSIRIAEKEGGFDSSAISKCCKGKYKNHKGFLWKYCET